MDHLKEKFRVKASALFTKTRALLKEHGDVKVDEVKLRQIFGGARGVKTMVWDTSQLDAIEGIRFRGYSIPQLNELLPSAEGDNQPLPEGLFYLMLTGDLPTQEDVAAVAQTGYNKILIGISASPDYTYRTLSSDGGSTSDAIINNRNKYESGKIGYIVGLNFNYNFSRKWGLITGVLYSNKGYQSILDLSTLTFGDQIHPRRGFTFDERDDSALPKTSKSIKRTYIEVVINNCSIICNTWIYGRVFVGSVEIFNSNPKTVDVI